MANDTPNSLPPLAGWKGSIADVLEDMAADPALDEFDMAFKAKLARYGDRVRVARKARGWNQGDLSEASGLTQSNISKIESGTMTDGPTSRTMQRLAVALGEPSLENLTEPDTASRKLPAPAAPDVVSKVEPVLVDPVILGFSWTRLEPVMSKAFAERTHATKLGHLVCVIPTADGNADVNTVPSARARRNYGGTYLGIWDFAQTIPTESQSHAAVNTTRNVLLQPSDPEDQAVAVNVLSGWVE